MTIVLSTVTELAENLAFLVGLTYVYGFMIRHNSAQLETFNPVLNGSLFGAIAIIGMQFPIHISDGIFIDGRTVLVMLASPFAGPLAGVIATIIVAGYRFYLGGDGAIAGVGAIITAGAVGIVFAHRFIGRPGDIKIEHLLSYAIPMSFISLLWVFALPGENVALPILQKLILPVGTMYPVGTVALGLMLSYEYRRIELMAALDQSEKRFSDFSAAASDWFWEMDRNLKFTHLSDRFFEISGFTREEKIGTTREELFDLVYENGEPEKITAHLQTLKDRYPFKDFEYSIIAKNGKHLRLRTSGVPVFSESGEFCGYRGTGSDISDHKEMEELRDRTALINLLRQTARDANMATTFDEATHTCLATVNEYTGWPIGHVYLLSEEEEDLLVPSSIWYLEDPKRFSAFVSATNRATFKRGIGLPGRVLEKGEPAWIVDVAKDENFPRAKLAINIGVHGAFAFPVLAEGKVVAVLEFFDEKADEPDESLLATVVHIGSQLGRVFERKQAEIKLRQAFDEIDQSNRGLEQTVKERTRELHFAIEEAETASLTKTEFLANMSHELRTPLNAIIGFSEMIKSAMFGPLGSQYQEYAKDINISGQHLLGLISDILDISKIEAGKLDIDEKPIVLSDLVSDCEMMVRSRVEEAKMTLAFDVGQHLPILNADPLRVKQILLNLISNALKFTPENGLVTVTGSVDDTGAIVLAVKDTGIGIAASNIDIVQEKFGQIRDGHTHAHEGAGLGLALAKFLMELHGGTLTIDSVIDQGTTIVICFPPGRTNKPPDQRTPEPNIGRLSSPLGGI